MIDILRVISRVSAVGDRFWPWFWPILTILIHYANREREKVLVWPIQMMDQILTAKVFQNGRKYHDTLPCEFISIISPILVCAVNYRLKLKKIIFSFDWLPTTSCIGLYQCIRWIKTTTRSFNNKTIKEKHAAESRTIFKRKSRFFVLKGKISRNIL